MKLSIPCTFEPGLVDHLIDNRSLDGFLAALRERGCSPASCMECSSCADIARKYVRIDPAFHEEALARAQGLTDGVYDGSHWW